MPARGGGPRPRRAGPHLAAAPCASPRVARGCSSPSPSPFRLRSPDHCTRFRQTDGNGVWRAPRSCGSLGIVKRSTVVRHFREIADAATRVAGFDPGTFDLPALVEVWIGGDLVERHGEIDHVVAVLVLDVPADQLPEISLHPAERAAVSWLEIEKRPMITRSRPATRQPWSHLERRVAPRVVARSGGRRCQPRRTGNRRPRRGRCRRPC